MSASDDRKRDPESGAPAAPGAPVAPDVDVGDEGSADWDPAEQTPGAQPSATGSAPLSPASDASWGGSPGRRRRRSVDGGGTFWGWIKQTFRLWGFFAFILFVLFSFRAVVLPFVLAMLVTYVLSPVLNFSCRLQVAGRRLPRFIWLIALYLAIFFMFGLFFTSLVPRVSKDLKRMVGEAPAFWQKARRDWVPRAAGWVHANFGEEPAAPPKPVVKAPTKPRKPPRLKIKHLPDGSLELDMRQLRVEVVSKGNGLWVVRGARSAPRAPETGKELQKRFEDYIQGLVQSSEQGVNQVFKLGQRAVFGVLSAITTLILLFMISAFLLIDTQRIINMLRGLVDQRYHTDFDAIVKQIDKGLSGAIRGQLLICVVNAVLTWIGLMLFSVKYSVLLALLAGIMSLIPIFGSILSSFPIVLVAMASGETGVDLLRGVLMLVWIIGVHLLEANLLNPKIIGAAAKIHPVIVIFAVVAGERTYGAVGALLAVPFASAVQAVFIYVRHKVRSDAPSSPPAPSAPPASSS